jgi:primosomal protein N' (replication factor Y)
LRLAEPVLASRMPTGRLIDAVHDVLRIGNPLKHEVVVVASSRVEVNIADLHHSLVHRLLVVDVLHPLQPRLLHLAGDDAAADVEAAVGDRVGRRDPLDEADQNGQADDDEDEQEDGAVAGVEELEDDAGKGRDQDSLQVEAEDRPPGGVALEDHLLSRAEVERHLAQHTLAVRAPPYRDPVSIAKVEPLTTARALKGPFDYRLPAEMADVGVGSVVRVPFGRQRLLGVVVELAEASELPPERLAEPLEALEAGTPAELVRLGLWIAREYCSTPSRGLQLVLPPGTGAGGQRVRTRLERRAEIAAAGEEALSGGERLGVKQRAVLEALRGGEMSAAELAAAVGADSAVLRRLEQRGLILTRSTQVRRRSTHPEVGAPGGRPELLDEQVAAVKSVVAALDGEAGAPREQLLHGVTGSGKTEVYLAAVEAALARGKSAIVLVPEIGLAPQAVARFRARLGDRFAVLHSALPDGERYDEWRRLRDGEASVCVGPRSAVFAPLRELGLIVIDEEHDPSYKQEGDPCYDARAVARRRAAECGAVLLAGTATPRPESWLELPRLELPRRVDGRPLPPVQVLDMREADPRGGPLHTETWAALERVRREGAKAIVMVNRRGFAPWLTCRSCGDHWSCPNCDVSLIVHRHSGRLVCHHCAHAEPLPRSCPVCDSTTLSRAGVGTEQVEALLAERLAPMPVFRLDADTAAGRGAHARILAAFGEAESGVLVGTQMVAKGHDFPEVTLSAILDADATLRFPDFRAGERTFAMVAQLAGRSGRGAAGGAVIVQTLAPTAPSIVHAAGHDARAFLATEVERRRALRYPPFSHLTRIVLKAELEPRLERCATDLAEALTRSLPSETELLGPAPMFRVRNRHRRRLLLKAEDREGTIAAVRSTVERLATDRTLRDVAISVDVDPQ